MKYGSLYDILDGAKIADSLMLLLSSSSEGIDEFGENCLSCLMGQGMPSVTLVTQVCGVIVSLYLLKKKVCSVLSK